MDHVLTDVFCSDCDGPLRIVEENASFIMVVCTDCGNSHWIEITTDPDGKLVYWPSFRFSLNGDVTV